MLQGPEPGDIQMRVAEGVERRQGRAVARFQQLAEARASGGDLSPFPEFWPQGNRLYVPLTGIQPGEVGVINLAAPGGMKLSTGIMVIYADDTSFSFLTPEGHMFAGMITFSAREDAGVTVAQVEALIRANDPLYEASFRLGFGHKAEDAFWRATLVNLSRHFGVADPQPSQTRALVDPRVQWPEWRNIRHNAGIRTALYMPVALLRKTR